MSVIAIPSDVGSGTEHAAARMAKEFANPGTLLRGLMARTRWPTGKLRDCQRRRLAGPISHAVMASLYYRRVPGPDAVSAPLEDLPTLPKGTLMDEFHEVVTDPAPRLADLRTHLAGPRAAQLYRDHLVVATLRSTPCTTSRPASDVIPVRGECRAD